MITYRYLKIKIDNKDFVTLDETNPACVRVNFDFREFDGAETPNKIISINNLNLADFANVKPHLNKKFELYAGLKTYGVARKTQDLIGFGYIQNIITNDIAPQGGYTANQVDFILGIAPQEKEEKKKYLFEIKQGEPIKQKIKACLLNLYSLASVEIGGSEVNASDGEKFPVQNSYDLKNFAKRYKIQIYQTKQGFLIADEDYKGITPLRLDLKDFLEQPALQVGLIRICLALRGDLYIGQVIQIPQSLTGNRALGNSAFLVSQATPSPIVQGRYKIIKIWHKGDTRNLNYNAWATTIEAVVV